MRIPGCGFRLMCHPETTSQSECGFRDVLSAWAAIGKARPTLRCRSVCLTPAPCTEFDSPRYGGSVDGARPGQDARSASHLYWAGALRGESAYLLRKYAPASAACRRPRPRAKNAYAFSLRPRPAQSSILRGRGLALKRGMGSRSLIGIASISGWGVARRIRVFASQIRTGFGRLPASSPAG